MLACQSRQYRAWTWQTAQERKDSPTEPKSYAVGQSVSFLNKSTKQSEIELLVLFIVITSLAHSPFQYFDVESIIRCRLNYGSEVRGK